MQFLNVRLLAIIVGAGVVFAIVVFALNRYQIYRHANFFYNRAQLTKDSEDIEQRVEATNNLRRYLSMRPDDNDVRAELGELTAEIAKNGGPKLFRLYGDAFYSFEHVLRNDYTRTDVRRKLVEVAIITRRYDDAKEHLVVLLEESPNDAELLTWMGRCQIDAEEYDQAIESLKKAIANAPHETEAYSILASLLRKDHTLRGDRDLHPMVQVEADDNSLAVDDKNASNPATASEDKTSTKATDSDNKSDVENDSTASNSNKQEAVEVAVDKDPSDTKPEVANAPLAKPDESHPDTWMNRLVEANPQSPQALLIRGEYLHKTHKPEEARNDAVNTIQYIPNMMKSLSGSLQKTAEAIQACEKSLTPVPDSVKEAVAKLNDVSTQLLAASKNVGSLSENEEAPNEDTIAQALRSTANVLKLSDKALSNIVVQGDRNENNSQLIAAVKQAKAEAKANYESISESLQGSLLLLAKCEADKLQYDNASLYALRTLKFFPDYAYIYAFLSQLETAQENDNTAREWIDRGLVQTEDSPILLWEKANFLINDLGNVGKNQEEQSRILKEITLITEKIQDSVSIYKMPAFTTYLSARQAYVQGQWAKAAKLLETVRTDLVNISSELTAQCDKMSSVCYRRLERPELAREAARRSIEAPGSIAGRFGTIAKLLAQGKVDEAFEKIDEMEGAGNFDEDAWIILAKNNLDMNRMRKKPQQDWDTLKNILVRAKKYHPDDIRTTIIDADALVAQDKTEEAIQLLKQECKKNPKELKLWLSLARIAQNIGDWQLAEESLDEAEKQVGDSVDLRILRAAFLVGRDKKDSIDKLRTISQNVDAFNDADRTRLFTALSFYAKKAEDIDLAQNFCLQACESDPTNIKLRVMLFEAALLKKDDKAMAEAVEDIHNIEVEGPLWHYYEAVRLASSSEGSDDNTKALDTAMEHLNQAKILRPNWERIPMLAGQIQLRRGDKEAAVENFVDAVEQGYRESRVISILVGLLYEQGRNDEAQRYSELLDDQDATVSTRTKRLQAQDMVMRGDLQQGLKYFLQIAENSDDYRDHLNLGLVLAALSRQSHKNNDADRANKLSEEAEKSLRKAIQLAPNEAAVWLALVRFFNSAGKKSNVSNVIDEARKTVSAERLPLVLAICYENMGRNAEAEQQFIKAAANSDGNDFAARYLAGYYLKNQKYDIAEKLIKKIIDGEQKASASDIRWARRRQAILLTSRSGLPNRRDAIALLDKNLEEDPMSINDMREKAKILTTFSNKKDRQESRKLLEKLVSKPNPQQNDRFLMAKVLLAENDWPGVTRQMRQLLATDDVKPEWLRFYISALLNRDEIGEASSYLKRLERLEPDSQAVVQFRAVLLARRGQYDRIIKTLEEYTDNPINESDKDLTPKENEKIKITRLVNTANILEGIIKSLPTKETGSDPKAIDAAKMLTDKAEQIWRKIAEMYPEANLRLVRFLSEHNQRDEALSIVENSWQKGHPSDVATTVVSLIFTGETTPQQINRVERIINDAMIYFGENNSLILAKAELRSIQRQYEEAEAFYRKVLDKDPRNVVALNNLAVFLSLRNMKQDESLKMINEAIAIAGPKPTLLDSRATVYLAQGEWQKALDDLADAISINPTPTRFLHQAQAYYMGKDKEEAQESFKRAHKLGLAVNKLQPLERPAYRELRDALK